MLSCVFHAKRVCANFYITHYIRALEATGFQYTRTIAKRYEEVNHQNGIVVK